MISRFLQQGSRTGLRETVSKTVWKKLDLSLTGEKARCLCDF